MRRNVDAARDVGLQVAECGAYPVIPHTMTADFDKLLTDQFWLEGTLALLARCDAIFLMDTWGLSQGARAEQLYARSRGLPEFDTTRWDRLRAWVADEDWWMRATLTTLAGGELRGSGRFV